LVFKFGDSQILYFNGVSDCPFHANLHGRKVVNFFKQLELGSSVEGLTLEVQDQGFSILNGEEDLQVVEFDFFGVVEDIQIHLFARFKEAFSGLNVENLILQDVPLKSLVVTWLTWVSPGLKLNLLVVRHLEAPISSHTPYVLKS
jgi:hypothetical protein